MHVCVHIVCMKVRSMYNIVLLNLAITLTNSHTAEIDCFFRESKTFSFSLLLLHLSRPKCMLNIKL